MRSEVIIFCISTVIALCGEGSRNFEIIVEQIFGILETTFNPANANKKESQKLFVVRHAKFICKTVANLTIK